MITNTFTQCRGKIGKDMYTTAQAKSTHIPKHMNTEMALCPQVGEKNKPDIGIDHRAR